MNLKLLPLEMYFNEDGLICINQPYDDPYNDYPNFVLLSKDMVDTVINNLKQMKEEMIQREKEDE